MYPCAFLSMCSLILDECSLLKIQASANFRSGITCLGSHAYRYLLHGLDGMEAHDNVQREHKETGFALNEIWHWLGSLEGYICVFSAH